MTTTCVATDAGRPRVGRLAGRRHRLSPPLRIAAAAAALAALKARSVPDTARM